MNINGKTYVEKEKIDLLHRENEELKSQNEKMRKIIQMILPIDKDKFDFWLLHGFPRAKNYILYHIEFGDNERLRYEKEIDELKGKLSGANSQIGKLKKVIARAQDGEVPLRKVEITQLRKMKSILDEIFDE